MEQTSKRLAIKRVLLFCTITFALSYAFAFAVIYPIANTVETHPENAAIVSLLFSAYMFFPSIGVLFTRLMTKERFQNAFLRLHLKGNVKTYLLAWFGPAALCLVGAAVWFLWAPSTFDPNLGYVDTLLNGQPLPMSKPVFVLVQLMQGVLLAPLVNGTLTFGEEWGWRGYLLPKLGSLLPTLPTLLLSGVIWGLWHAPLIALGHNYGTGYASAPWGGILMMCVFCIFFGVFLAYLTMKTESCWPAVIAHAALNGFAAFSAIFTRDGGNPFLGPLPTGIVGMSGIIVAAVLLYALWFGKKAKSEEETV